MLYKVETMADDQGLDYEARAELRARLAYPIMCAFEKWIVSYMPKALPQGRMSKALKYTYSLFHRLSRYHLDGRYKMDNNLMENSIRPLALGYLKKMIMQSNCNYLFAGSHDAAQNIAMFYSFLGTCKKLDIDPQKWLKYVMENIHVTPAENFKELLPQFIDKSLL